MIHVTQLVHSFHVGGAEILAANLARGLRAKGMRSSFWAMADEGILKTELTEGGIETVSFGCPQKVSPRAVFEIICSMRKHQIDIIVTHHFRQLFHASLAALITGTKIVHIEHDYHFYEESRRYRKALRFLLRFTSSFIVVSKKLTVDFREGLGLDQECKAVENGIDMERFCKSDQVRVVKRERYKIDEDTFVIGTCARLEPVKQIDLLIDGFALYQKINPAACLVVVGHGSEAERLQLHASQCGIEDKVFFLGEQTAVEDFYNMFDVFVLTSSHEGLPLAVLEAMATELPVIATNVGSLAAIVDETTGLLLSSQEPDILAKAFDKFQDSNVRKIVGKCARAAVAKNHSMLTMVGSYTHILQDAASSPAACFLHSFFKSK